MDTPLYVLSTAASMVESVDVAKCRNIEEASLRPTSGDHSSLANTVTMAFPMSTHYQDCQHLSEAGSDASLNSLSDNRKKCAGTQTAFSSFGASPYGPSEKYIKMESSSVAWHGGHKSASTSSPSPPGYYQRHNTIPAPQRHYGYSQINDVDMDSDMPLNLTKSSSTHQSNNNGGSNTLSSSSSSSVLSYSPSSSSSHRSPSPGSCCEPAATPKSSAMPAARLSVIIRNQPLQKADVPGVQPVCSNVRNGRSLGNCDDPEIEEHFRRSLGTKYQSYMTGRSSPRNGETAELVSSNSSNVSITGNVDDHFAKSLGETWTQLNAKKQSPLTGTVDDHFAKALGETWYKIKAKVETESRPSANVVHL